MDLSGAIQLITPAVLISVFVFLVKFFGKVQADEVPFADDRGWHEEVSGIMFIYKYCVANFFSLILIAVFVGCRPWLNNGFWMWTSGIILFYIPFHLVCRASTYLFKMDIFAKIANDEKLISGLKKAKYPDIEFFTNTFLWFQKKYSGKISETELSVVAAFSLFFSLVIFFSGNIVYAVLIGFVLFIIFFFIAVTDSLLKVKKIVADIVLKNGEILEDCTVLKINKDNIKYKYQEQFYILNKDSFLKLKIIKEVPMEFTSI